MTVKFMVMVCMFTSTSVRFTQPLKYKGLPWSWMMGCVK